MPSLRKDSKYFDLIILWYMHGLINQNFNGIWFSANQWGEV